MIMLSSRDGQKVDGNTLGGVISNLHLPRDWWIFEVEPTGPNRRVHFAIGCHPKQAAQLTPPLLKRLEELVRTWIQPAMVGYGFPDEHHFLVSDCWSRHCGRCIREVRSSIQGK